MAMKPTPLRHLLGSILADVVKGEAIGAAATLEVIRQAGFQGETEGDDWGKPRFIRFTYLNTAGEAQRVAVPIVSLIPLPTIEIAEMEVAFSATVADARTSRESRTSPLDLLVALAPEGPDPDRRPVVRVRATLKPGDLPSGLLDLAGVSQISVEDE